ncbi:hypothetical protein GF314_00760 [bacterium]|nr:hypothetical protein [bacterium]
MHSPTISRHARLLVRTWGLALGVLVLASSLALAAWDHDDHAVVFDATGELAAVATCTDGHGGLLSAVLDDTGPGWVSVSRLDHTGNEVWGDEGVLIPFAIGSDGKAAPLDVAPDGDGGAWLVFRELWPGGQHIVTIAHVTPDGVLDLYDQVEDFVADSASLQAFAVPTSTTDVIIVWTANHPHPNEIIVAAKYRVDGSRVWLMQVANQVHLAPALSFVWKAAPDGGDGLLVAFERQVGTGPTEWRVQKLDASGNVPWGANGVQLWTNSGEVGGVMSDGAGGALVMNDHAFGQVDVQRVDAAGSAVWPAGGVRALDLNLSLGLDIAAWCSDGAGGAIVVTGSEDLHAQRVDAAGDRTWAGGSQTGVVLTTRAGWQEHPTVCPDGTGGAIVVYRDHYWSDGSDPNNQMLAGVRVGALGAVLWPEPVLWDSGWQDGLEPWWPCAVSDGTGGALVCWQEREYVSLDGDVLALGVDGDGTVPAAPELVYLEPDAAPPGAIFPAALHGQYLDPAQTFTLERPGAVPLPITPVALASPTLMEVEVDLSGGEEGAWDLVVARDGAPVDTLVAALGIGEPPPCEDASWNWMADNVMVGLGSRREAAFDPAGTVHDFNLMNENGLYHIARFTIGDPGPTWDPVYQAAPGEVLGDLCAFVDHEGRQHVVVIEGPGTTLRYLLFSADGTLDSVRSVGLTNPARHPALAVNLEGVAHVVLVEDRGSEESLVEYVITDDDIDGPDDLGAGADAREPDLVRWGDEGFLLAWVRDFWVPGLREVCYRFHDGQQWGPIEAPYFGVTVTSPSVAWDGHETSLLAFVLDNTGSAPLLHTCRIVEQERGPVRWRLGEPLVHRAVVSTRGEDAFYLLTQESETGLPMHVNLRWGDGRVFYPKRLLNDHGDVDLPVLASCPSAVYARWDHYGEPDLVTYDWYHCPWGEPVPVPDAEPGHRVLAAHPNPFNPQTELTFELARAGRVELDVYDLAGRRVARLVASDLPAGLHHAVWSGRDDHGRPVSSGTYLARLHGPGAVGEQVTKITLVK